MKSYRSAESLAELRRGGAQVVRPPARAVAFDYRQVVFLMLPNMWMVELIEGRPGELDQR